MSDKLKLALKWGGIGGLISAVIGLVFYILNVDSSSYLNYLSYAVLVGVLLFGVYEYRDKHLGGYISFKQIMGYGIFIVIVFALLSSIWGIVYMETIDTNLVNEILLKTELDMEEKGLDEEIIQQTLVVTKKMMQPQFFFITSFLFLMLFGTLGNLLVGAVLKKEKPENVLIDETASVE